MEIDITPNSTVLTELEALLRDKGLLEILLLLINENGKSLNVMTRWYESRDIRIHELISSMCSPVNTFKEVQVQQYAVSTSISSSHALNQQVSLMSLLPGGCWVENRRGRNLSAQPSIKTTNPALPIRWNPHTADISHVYSPSVRAENDSSYTYPHFEIMSIECAQSSDANKNDYYAPNRLIQENWTVLIEHFVN